MNLVLNFLQENWQRVGLSTQPSSDHISCLILTPRFRASRHIVVIVFQNRGAPFLVGKVPRLVESASLEREACNLQAIQASQEGGLPSVPSLITYEPYLDRMILLETALIGQPIDPPFIRRDPNRCCNLALNWLKVINTLTQKPVFSEPAWFYRLVEQPLDMFEKTMPLSREEGELLERTRDLVMPLSQVDLPLVFEHGDLSHPNLLLLKNQRMGVLDWEMAEADGLPACDLFFFLSYVAFARKRARSVSHYLAAFRSAFFGDRAWANSFILNYIEHLSIPSSIMPALFVACWTRYMLHLLGRLEEPSLAEQRLDDQTVAWFRSNRYYALWRFTLDHICEFPWHRAGGG